MMRGRIKVTAIYGTRPEAIKMAPVIKRLQNDGQFCLSSVVTAQHREMLDQVLRAFEIRPDHDLAIMVQNQTLSQIVANSICKLDRVLREINPHIILVQGDTSTTFVAALAAFYNHLPIGHIEAGLRTRDRFQPFPEEVNRRLTSVVADFHFAPTDLARKNLLAEGVDPKNVFVTGNTVIDAFQLASQTGADHSKTKLPVELASKRIIFVTAHRRENLGKPLRSVCHALRDLVRRYPDVAVVFPVHFNPKVREVVFPLLSNQDRIWLTDPMEYVDTARMIRQSTLVLTDSGGIQEEAPSVGKPVLVMRNTTERPEGIMAGNARLVGTDKNMIISTVSTLLTDSASYRTMANAVNPYGDGKAADRIAKFLLYIFGKQRQRPRPFLA